MTRASAVQRRSSSNYLITFDDGHSEECNIGNLVHYLDSKIEKIPDYDDAVLKWLEGQHH